MASLRMKHSHSCDSTAAIMVPTTATTSHWTIQTITKKFLTAVILLTPLIFFESTELTAVHIMTLSFPSQFSYLKSLSITLTQIKTTTTTISQSNLHLYFLLSQSLSPIHSYFLIHLLLLSIPQSSSSTSQSSFTTLPSLSLNYSS